MEIVLGLIGGLGLFIFGMRNMSDGLQKTAGERLKRLLEVLTTNRVSGVLMGTLVTALIQSSSTTTVMVVGFVNARLMTLQQAVGVIMGANIGTTFTAQLIAFRLEAYAPAAIGLGAALHLFSRSERVRHIGQVILGFGLLFLGLSLMSDSLRPLRGHPAFSQLLVGLGQNPIFGVIAGTAVTVMVQSSSASIGLLQSLASEGLIPIEAALPILFGDNIGTTITAVLSAIGASLAAKRAAAVHVVFNLVGTILFVLALPLVLPIVVASSESIARQIANAHTIFNTVNTLIQLPAAGLIVWLVQRLVPGEEPAEEPDGPLHLDERFLDTPSVALDLARQEVQDMAALAREVVADSLGLLLDGSGPPPERIFEKERRINTLNEAISAYLAQISRRTASAQQQRMIRDLHHIIADVERVGDHGENILELAIYSRENALTYSDAAVAELRELAEAALEAYDLAVRAWSESDPALARLVFEKERRVDQLEKEVRATHIDRLNRGLCHPSSGVVFLDLASNLERVADHAAGIAATVPSA